jgi:hypothetical protein
MTRSYVFGIEARVRQTIRLRTRRFKTGSIAALCGDGLRPELQALFDRLAIDPRSKLLMRPDGMLQYSGPDPESVAPVIPIAPMRVAYGAWNSKRNWDVQEELKAFAESRGWTLPQMSLAWLLSRPAISTIIAGADKPEHIAQNIKALEIKFTPEDLVEIDRLTLIDEDRSVAPVYRKLRPEKVHEFGPMQVWSAKTRQ